MKDYWKMPNLIVDENKLLIENQKDSPESYIDLIGFHWFSGANDDDRYEMGYYNYGRIHSLNY